MSTNRNKRTGPKGYIWLLMAVFCIVFSGATRWFIEQKVNHSSYASAIVPYGKRIKDNCRDKRQSLTAIVLADHATSTPDLLDSPGLLAALVSFALFYLVSARSNKVAYVLQPIPVPDQHLYLRDSRLQV